MRYTLGESWWERAHYRSKDEIKLKNKIHKGNIEAVKEKAKLEQENEVKNRMGWLRYTFMPWERNRIKLQILRIKNIANEMAAAEEEDELTEKEKLKKALPRPDRTSSVKRNTKESRVGAYEVKR